MTWDALRKSINGLVNKVNIMNIKQILPEFFGEVRILPFQLALSLNSCWLTGAAAMQAQSHAAPVVLLPAPVPDSTAISACRTWCGGAGCCAGR